MNLAHKIHFFINRELSEVYVSYAIRAFALSLIGIFIPIFLLASKYSLNEVLLFFFLTELFGVPFVFIAAKVTEKIGFKHTILLSAPTLILFFFLLLTLERNPTPLWMLGLIYAFSTLLFWLPFHFEFAKNSDHKKRSFEFGLLETCALLVVVFGPLAGAAIISHFSFNALFVIVSLFLFLSTFPLFLSGDKKLKFNINFEKFSLKHKKDCGIFFCEGVMDYSQVILWPIFIFLMLGGIFYLGIISTIGGFFTAFIPALVGKLTERFSKEKFMKIGSLISSPSSVLRGFFSSFTWISFWTALSGIGTAIFYIPFISRFYDNAARNKYEQYIAFREVYVRIGRAALFLLLIILLSLGLHWQYAFIIGFVLGALALLVS